MKRQGRSKHSWISGDNYDECKHCKSLREKKWTNGKYPIIFYIDKETGEELMKSPQCKTEQYELELE